jgi:hypothetical protein
MCEQSLCLCLQGNLSRLLLQAFRVIARRYQLSYIQSVAQKNKKLESGFGIVELVVALVAVALIVVAGWVIYDHHKKSIPAVTPTTSTKTTKQTSEPATAKTADPTAKWTQVDSIGGAYSIKIPDGWGLTNYPGNTLNGDNLTFSAGTPAIIPSADSAYARDQKKFNVTFSDKQYAAPQWQSPNQFGTEASTDFSVGSVKGTKYSIEYTQTVTGVTKGDKVYQYVFNLSSGKQLSVVYMQNAGDADNLKTVEQTIQTIVIN